jgi:hypothetical protein
MKTFSKNLFRGLALSLVPCHGYSSSNSVGVARAKEVALMRRVKLLLAAVAVMVAMLAAAPGSAMAHGQANVDVSDHFSANVFFEDFFEDFAADFTDDD